MKLPLTFFTSLILMTQLQAQHPFSDHELSLNLFRNPSIGIEYRYKWISAHFGYYPTVISKDDNGINENTNFIKAGFSVWYYRFGESENPSSLYSSFSWVYGMSDDFIFKANPKFAGKNGFIAETGVRWMATEAINLRLGIAFLTLQNEPLKINPTPGISYSWFFNKEGK